MSMAAMQQDNVITHFRNQFTRIILTNAAVSSLWVRMDDIHEIGT